MWVETAKVFDMLLAVPKYGRVKVNKVLVAVPYLAEQDDRRALAAPAHRAGQHAAPLAALAPGSSSSPARPGVGKGTLIRTLLERVPGARAVRLRHDAPAAAGRGARRRLPLPQRRGVRAPRRATATSSSTPRYSGRRYGTLRSELEQPPRPPGVPSCWRSSSRAPARSASRCPTRCRSSSPRRATTALRARLVGRGTDAAEQVAARLADGARGARRPGRVRPRGGQRPPRGRLGRARGVRAGRLAACRA